MSPQLPSVETRHAGAQPTSSQPAPMRRRPIDSRQLLAGARELAIEHLGQTYHLRLTRNDKLILTK